MHLPSMSRQESSPPRFSKISQHLPARDGAKSVTRIKVKADVTFHHGNLKKT
jgi:hypothetical protein